MSTFTSLRLIDRVNRGELNFKRFVEILTHTGYITEETREVGCSFISTAIEAVRQEDFDLLFQVSFPNQQNHIVLCHAATDKGGFCGSFAYALFNSAVIDREQILSILQKESRANIR